MIKEELKKVNLVEEKTNSFSIKGFEGLKISPLVASIFLAGRSPLARRLLANMRLELINSRMAVEGFNFMLDGIQQGAQNIVENPSYLSGLLWLLSLIGGVGSILKF